MIFLKGVNWLADPLAKSKKISEKMLASMNPEKGVSKKYYWIAVDALKKAFPHADEKVANETSDVYLDLGKCLIFGTHPRPYKQEMYDCLKSDIVVFCEKGEYNRALAFFIQLKKAADERKARLKEHLERINPLLASLLKLGLVDGAIGRGSYFDINGYPSANDNINIVLLNTKKQNRSAYKNIVSRIKEVIRSSKVCISATFTERNSKLIKKCGKELYDFMLVTPNLEIAGIFYEKYVIAGHAGISIGKTSKKMTEKIAKEISGYMPKRDERMEFVRKGVLSLMPRTKKRSSEQSSTA